MDLDKVIKAKHFTAITVSLAFCCGSLFVAEQTNSTNDSVLTTETNRLALAGATNGEHVEVLVDTHTNRISRLQKTEELANYQLELEAAQKLREQKELKRAESAFIKLLESRAPTEIKRPA